MFIRSDCRPPVSDELGREAWTVAQLLGANPASAAGPSGQVLPNQLVAPAIPQVGGRPMRILLVGHRDDSALDVLATDIADWGGEPIRTTGRNDITMRLRLSRSGTASVEIAAGPDRLLVDAIVNRGLSLSDDSDEDDTFAASEWLATWWTALALFNGKVANRPLRDCISLSRDALIDRAAGGGQCVPGRYDTIRPHTGPGCALHAYRWDGAFETSLHASLTTQSCVEIRAFDPSTVEHLLIAGSTPFDLGGESLSPDPGVKALIDMLVQISPIAFCHLTIVRAQGEARILSLSPVAPFAYYQHIASQVHAALIAGVVA